MRTGPNALERVIAAVDEHRAWGQVDQWDCDLEVHPKWHRKDRLSISGQRSTGGPCTFMQAHFRIRKDGVGLCFRPGDDYSEWPFSEWSELVFERSEWHGTAVASAVWACVFLWAVPGDSQRESLGMPVHVQEDVNGKPYEVRKIMGMEIKGLQVKLRKCSVSAYRPSSVPACVNKALDLLHGRFMSLTGVDVKEALQGLDRTFRFLHSRNVPFDRVREAWDLASVAEVMEG